MRGQHTQRNRHRAEQQEGAQDAPAKDSRPGLDTRVRTKAQPKEYQAPGGNDAHQVGEKEQARAAGNVAPPRGQANADDRQGWHQGGGNGHARQRCRYFFARQGIGARRPRRQGDTQVEQGGLRAAHDLAWQRLGRDDESQDRRHGNGQQHPPQGGAGPPPYQPQVTPHHPQAYPKDGGHERGDEHGTNDNGRAVLHQSHGSDSRGQADHDEKVHVRPCPIPDGLVDFDLLVEVQGRQHLKKPPARPAQQGAHPHPRRGPPDHDGRHRCAGRHRLRNVAEEHPVQIALLAGSDHHQVITPGRFCQDALDDRTCLDDLALYPGFLSPGDQDVSQALLAHRQPHLALHRPGDIQGNHLDLGGKAQRQIDGQAGVWPPGRRNQDPLDPPQLFTRQWLAAARPHHGHIARRLLHHRIQGAAQQVAPTCRIAPPAEQEQVRRVILCRGQDLVGGIAARSHHNAHRHPRAGRWQIRPFPSRRELGGRARVG